MRKEKILWADDEIELLKPHIIFLEQKGYELDTVNNGYDAIEQVELEYYDLVILDENMPGINGLETLQKIKEISPATPVIMITKSEEEDIMNEAIGSKIADYLIKPVNPNQIFLSIKKNVHIKEIIQEKNTIDYQQDFKITSDKIDIASTIDNWKEIYKILLFWDIELDKSKIGRAHL